MDRSAMFQMRREKFMSTMEGGVALFRNAPLALRSNDVHFKYRADNDFYYLSGFEEPNAALLLAPGHAEHRCVLFVQPKNAEEEVWTGWRAGVEGAVEQYGADAAYPIGELQARLKEHLKNVDTLYYCVGRDVAFDAAVAALLQEYRLQRRLGVHGPSRILDPTETVHEMRLFKSAAEVELMRRAAAVSMEAHRVVMRAVRPGMREYELEALMEYQFRSRGATGAGYPSIVGSGANATVLHYVRNDATIGADDLVLIDAGAEHAFYTADITRTFPASGRFTVPQRAVYEVVLRAQQRAIARVRPGASFVEVHETALACLVEGLVDLGILRGDVPELIAAEAYRRFYMHRTSHWLGMDVHDVGKYKLGETWRALEPGMVLTVEPGLYIAPRSEGVASQFWGIGVRIEDDVLVTQDGCEVLTGGLEKEPDALEALVGANP
ncbi:MAG: aminopeptidase P N-terminal domain-containing protein [Candidatus Tectomicrobia bacterium]|nr:aminopeptidase P N-terminal domain-containing protein [Candidatus Tectomicrobia bacterium]